MKRIIFPLMRNSLSPWMRTDGPLSTTAIILVRLFQAFPRTNYEISAIGRSLTKKIYDNTPMSASEVARLKVIRRIASLALNVPKLDNLGVDVQESMVKNSGLEGEGALES